MLEAWHDIRFHHKAIMINYLQLKFILVAVLGVENSFSSVYIDTMKMVTSQEEYDKAKSQALIELECYECKKIFTKTKHYVHNTLNKNWHSVGKYCSIQCAGIAGREKVKTVCKHCNKELVRTPATLTANNFCDHSCAATYQNTHKTKGFRISKLELFLQKELPELYPALEFHFNRKDTIISELDIYIPSLKLAFELNGIFHYEPIYGQDKLTKIQNNDSRKFQACLERGIEFCTIDVSQFKKFKPERAKVYLEIVTKIIDLKLLKN